MTKPITNSPITSAEQFCVLAFPGPDFGASQSHNAIPIVLILSNEDVVSRILINPGWKKVIPESEWPYIEDLLLDWKQRLATDDESCRQQLRSLNFGPLITIRLGCDLAADTAAGALALVFKEL